jgi:acyl carrier protein phosphodiesterase
MNFLAHAYLSGDSDQVLLGNFIADFVKGKAAGSCQKNVYKGILLHREIDFFTDRHRRFVESKQRLWSKHRHYSSVIVDIFYDHFLAKNWQEYSTTPLHDFARHVYSTMQRFDALLPLKAKQVLPRMIADNWLVNNQHLDGINRAMQGMARRASFRSEMARATDDLQKDYSKFENDFRQFFPELARHATNCLRNLENLHFLAQKHANPAL